MKISVKIILCLALVAIVLCLAGSALYNQIASSSVEEYVAAQQSGSAVDLQLFADRLVYIGSLALISILLIFLIAAVVVLNAVLSPINGIINDAEELSEGNYNNVPPVANLGGEYGSLVKSLCYLRDRLQGSMLKLSKSYSREEVALREVEAANRKRSDFLANISRGLRDPLNSIIGFSGIINKEIDKGRYDYKLLEKTNIIYSSAEHLNGLISNLIELSRLDSDEVPIDVKHFETSEFMSDLVQYNVGDAELKNISIHTHFTSELPPVLTSDHEILFHVLSNLISNAIKASPFEGSVSFGVDCDDDYFTFWVEDSSAEDDAVPLARVYDKYVKSETELFNGIKGSSILCMTIVKAHVELLGASIETSVSSAGCSTFKVIFDADDIIRSNYEDDNTARFYRNAPPEGVFETSNEFDLHRVESVELSDSKPVNVLMAENNESNRMLVESILDEANCELEFVDDGLSCLDVLNRRDFDVLLLDLYINKLESLKVLETLRSNPRYQNLPVIIMAAYVDPQEKRELLLAGANDCILKPIDSEELIYLVRSWYKKSRDL